jgi:DNA-binding MarR family transcriptional regulator
LACDPEGGNDLLTYYTSGADVGLHERSPLTHVRFDTFSIPEYDWNVSTPNIRWQNVGAATVSRQREGGPMARATQLEHTVRRLISKTNELKHQRMHELLDELGLHRGQSFVLGLLWEHDGLAQSELADRLDRSPSTITKTVQRMEKAGLVERRQDESDERISRVYLTGAGRRIQPAVEAAWDRLNRQIFAGFSTEELASFSEFLTRVCRNIEAKS